MTSQLKPASIMPTLNATVPLAVTGLVTKRRAHDVAETISAIHAQAERWGAAVAAVVDHAAAARKAGLTMPETQVIIFGNPQLPPTRYGSHGLVRAGRSGGMLEYSAAADSGAKVDD